MSFLNLFLSFFLFFGGVAFKLKAKEDFIVGTTSGYAPYVSLNASCEYEGFDIDLARTLAEKMDKNLVIKDLGGLTPLFLSLKSGKIDAIIWAISITNAREKQMEMVYYQGAQVNTMPLLFWKEIPENVSGVEDLYDNPKAIVCVEAGSYQESFVADLPKLKVKQVDKITDAILELKYGKSRAAFADPSLLPRLLKQYPELRVMQVPLPLEQQSKGNGICINKKKADLAADVRKAVDELSKEGKVKALEEKWGLIDALGSEL